jgi:glycosyltransferase involved in cell wall biosynthesis
MEGRTDNTLNIIDRYSHGISYIISEPDKGPAAALNKGFGKASGDIMCWLNSDDQLHAQSLFSIAEIFNTIGDVDWLMGYPTWFTASGLCEVKCIINEINFIMILH